MIFDAFASMCVVSLPVIWNRVCIIFIPIFFKHFSSFYDDIIFCFLNAQVALFRMCFACSQGYFRSLFLEHLDKNIDVTIVCPGPIQTNFLAQSFMEKSGEVRVLI